MSDRAVLEFVSARRSALTLVAPGPSAAELESMLRAAGAVPDHGLLRPFRFVLVESGARERFGNALAAAAAEYSPGLPASRLQKMRDKAFRSPTLLAVVFSPKPGKIELWEQQVTASCAGYAVLLAAQALGVGAVWKSVPFTKAGAFSALLGLGEQEEMLGWIHLGTEALDQPLPARPALQLADVVSVLGQDGPSPYRSA